MADDKKPEQTNNEPPRPESAAPAANSDQSAIEAGTAPADGTTEPAPKHHDDIIADLRREISDLKDKILRAHAEVDNIRKRTEQEKKDTAKYAVTRFAHDIVNVGDNFQRAVTAVPAGAAESDPALKSLVDGVLLAEREFLNVLERHGVRRVDPNGEPFNPHLHQAVMQQPSAEVAPNTVLQVFQSGFTIEDRVLRPAMVVVSTAASKPEPAPSNAGESGTNAPPDGSPSPDNASPANPTPDDSPLTNRQSPPDQTT